MVINNKFWKNKRVFITGHTGFKGSWLTLWLVRMGAKVKGFSLEPPTQPNLFNQLGLDEDIDHNVQDIRDSRKLKASIVQFKPEVVFHLAAQPLVRFSYNYPALTHETNIMGTVNLLEALAVLNHPCSAVIVTTDKVYENRETDLPYIESDKLAGFDPYSTSKACAELVVESYRLSYFSKNSEIQIATVRSGNVIGGGDWAKDRLVPDLIRSLISDDVAKIRYPDAIRPWQHVLDPLAGYMLVAQNLETNEYNSNFSWNFGPSQESERTVGELAHLIQSLWGQSKKWEFEKSNQPYEAKILRLNSKLAKQKLAWHPQLGFEDAVRLTTHWYKSVSEGENAKTTTISQLSNYTQHLKSKANN